MGKKKYAEYEEEIKEALKKLEELRDRLVALTDADAEAFEPLSKAYGLPKETKEQQKEKEQILEAALYEASIVPVQIMETILDAMAYLETLSEKGNPLLRLPARWQDRG